MGQLEFSWWLLVSVFSVSLARWRRGPLRPRWSWGYEVVTAAQKRFHAQVARREPVEERRAWSRGRHGHAVFSRAGLLGAPSLTGVTMSLPGFRASCLTLAGLYVYIAGSILVRGPMVAMAPYAVPKETLASPHYANAILWVFLHMIVIGCTIGVVGWFATDVRLQRAFARLMLAALLVYTFLDVRTADWSLGTGLYKGPGSLAPVLVDVLSLLVWLRLNLVRASTNAASART